MTVGILRGEAGDVVVLDCDATESQCVDQLVHLSIDKEMRIHGFEQSKGLMSKQPCGLPAQIFSSRNLRAILSERVSQLE